MDVSTGRLQNALRTLGVASEHEHVIAQSVSDAYAGVDKMMKATPMFANFVPGETHRGYLLNIAVQHALMLCAGTTGLFYTNINRNEAGNYFSIQLQVKNVRFTSHYLGAHGNRQVRKAVYRSSLHAMNGDLFPVMGQEHYINVEKGFAYIQIIHAGTVCPVIAALQLPSSDQGGNFFDPLVLNVPPPSISATEEIVDRMRFGLKSQLDKQNGAA